MKWELFEVWAVDEYGYDTLVDTTKSEKEARELVKLALAEGAVEAVIYREVNDELEEFDRIVK